MAERPRLSPITETDRPVLERLWQLYSHDMSEVRGTLPNAEGMFKAGRLPTYLDDPDACGYLITYRDAPAGFAFVRTQPDATRIMGDFFVVRAARSISGVRFVNPERRERCARKPSVGRVLVERL